MKRTICFLLSLTTILFMFTASYIPASASYNSIDYGQYDSEVVNEFVQVSTITLGRSYIIALVDKQVVDSSSSTLNADVLANYGDYKLALIPAELSRTNGLNYQLSSSAVDGMVWNAINYDVYYNVERYSLFNNDVYLNVDDNTGLLQLDNDGYRTRWTTAVLSGQSFLEYAIGASLNYITDADFSMQSGTVCTETLPVTENPDEAYVVILLEAEPLKKDEAPVIPIAAASVPASSSTTRQQTTSYSEQTEQMVWLSASGDKYHSINNCGRMNPSKARQVALSVAIAQGYSPCSKCW